MANPWRGEVALQIDGERHLMRLTLGALAELEAGLGEDTLLALVARFEEGAFSSRDVLALIVAGLRGGGWQGGARDLLSADIGGGPVQAARLAGLLLLRAFSAPVAGDGSGSTVSGDAGRGVGGGVVGAADAVDSALGGADCADGAADAAGEPVAETAGSRPGAGGGAGAAARRVAEGCAGAV